MPAGDMASLIDHTLLRADATGADIDRLCVEAVEMGFATVCVNPTWVARAAQHVRGRGVGVGAVVGFPLGATTVEVKCYEAQRAISDGATEIDMVMNVGALKFGDLGLVERDIRAVVEVAGRDVVTKVIIEAALLGRDEKIVACRIARAAGAEFVKTSTGFGPGGATVEDVALMREVVGPDMGIKAAGGVRTLEAALALVAAGATRIGASAGVRIVQQARIAATRA